MSEKLLYILATFDEETLKKFKDIEYNLNEVGIIGKQTPGIPSHITMAAFETIYEDKVRQTLEEACSKTKSFELEFSHVGLFGMKVLFLAPNVSYNLLELRKLFERDCIKDDQTWTPHTTLLIDGQENIMKAIPIVANDFQQLRGKVKTLSLYEFFPARLVAEYELQ